MRLLTVAEVCPDPSVLKLEKDITGWNSDHPLFAQLIEQTNPKSIIEVGSWKGASAIHMAKLTEHLQTKIYCVDTFLGSGEFLAADRETDKEPCLYANQAIYHQFLFNVWAEGLQDRIYPMLQTSTTAARIFKYLGIGGDLIYIDASHQYEECFMDLEFYANLLRVGGIMFGDDYRDFPGTKMAVNRFAFERGLLLSTSGPAWVLNERTKKGAI